MRCVQRFGEVIAFRRKSDSHKTFAVLGTKLVRHKKRGGESGRASGGFINRWILDDVYRNESAPTVF